MTIKELLNQAVIMLKNENIDAPKNKARMLLQATLKKSREYLMIYDNKEVENSERDKYIKNVKRLILGEPLQYITGIQEFMKLNFLVTKDVLIPRPDTEILVEEVIKIAKKIKAKNILDMCTGSGAIAVSLAKYLDNVEITAVDISTKTLNVAKTNAKNNEVENKITFIESNLFENIVNEKYDIIVSNPPYIKKDVIKTLNKEVQKEPKIALDGGYDGLDFYRKITHQSEEYLKFNGYLCFEIGYDQKKDVIKIINDERKFTGTYSKKDLCDNDRIVVTRLD